MQAKDRTDSNTITPDCPRPVGFSNALLPQLLLKQREGGWRRRHRRTGYCTMVHRSCISNLAAPSCHTRFPAICSLATGPVPAFLHSCSIRSGMTELTRRARYLGSCGFRVVRKDTPCSSSPRSRAVLHPSQRASVPSSQWVPQTGRVEAREGEERRGKGVERRVATMPELQRSSRPASDNMKQRGGET